MGGEILASADHQGAQESMDGRTCSSKWSPSLVSSGDMLQTTLSRFSVRKLPAGPLPLMDEVAARFMDISPERWENMNSAIEYLNGFFKDESLSWLLVRWLVASHPEQFLPAPYNSYEELLSHVNDTKLAIDEAKEEADRWREAFQQLNSERQLWKRKMKSVEAEVTRLASALNTADEQAAPATSADMAEIPDAADVSIMQDWQTPRSGSQSLRRANSHTPKGWVAQQDEREAVQLSAEKGHQMLSRNSSVQHCKDSKDQVCAELSHPAKPETEVASNAYPLSKLLNAQTNSDNKKAQAAEHTSSTAETSGYFTMSTGNREKGHSASSKSRLNGHAAACSGSGKIAAAVIDNAAAMNVLNRMKDILCRVGGEQQDDGDSALMADQRQERDKAAYSAVKTRPSVASRPSVEVLYVKYQQQNRQSPTEPTCIRSTKHMPPHQLQCPALAGPETLLGAEEISDQISDPPTTMEQLVHLKQRASAKEYATRFMRVYSQGTDVPEDIAIRLFVANLLPGFRAYAHGHRPETLAGAIRLAYRIENFLKNESQYLNDQEQAFAVASSPCEGQENKERRGRYNMSSHGRRGTPPVHVGTDSAGTSQHVRTETDIHSPVDTVTRTRKRRGSEKLSLPCLLGSAPDVTRSPDKDCPVTCHISSNNHDRGGMSPLREAILREASSAASRKAAMTRSATLGSGKEGNPAELTFSGAQPLPTSTPRELSGSAIVESSRPSNSCRHYQHRSIPESNGERISEGTERQRRVGKTATPISSNKAAAAAAVAAATAAAVVSLTSITGETESQLEGPAFYSIGGSATARNQRTEKPLCPVPESDHVSQGSGSPGYGCSVKSPANCTAATDSFGNWSHEHQWSHKEKRSDDAIKCGKPTPTAKGSGGRKSFCGWPGFSKKSKERE
ncbi:hypothetical protein BESB_016420 [Besnoitia besnoiti]|uniref:Retrotransposon gag domain-containing protein n=1 Tax=Besnoitia besnoiti TaxID=94643 RepID=A0A2A9M540_BESBE|nr:hypothetical protein BESB_016420 [Besnoitia besnoiti]PFH32324.1 hypothetical protein BESB_016420 [Besnoitia besnoiti]